jgi:pilus assembly protein Flp/PilA
LISDKRAANGSPFFLANVITKTSITLCTPSTTFLRFVKFKEEIQRHTEFTVFNELHEFEPSFHVVFEMQITKESIMKLHKTLSPKAQKGVTMIEYALIAALIAVVAVVVLTDVGTALVGKFTAVKNAL